MLDFVLCGGIPPSVEALKAWLMFRDVDLSTWGSGARKSIVDLFDEVPHPSRPCLNNGVERPLGQKRVVAAAVSSTGRFFCPTQRLPSCGSSR